MKYALIGITAAFVAAIIVIIFQEKKKKDNAAKKITPFNPTLFGYQGEASPMVTPVEYETRLRNVLSKMYSGAELEKRIQAEMHIYNMNYKSRINPINLK